MVNYQRAIDIIDNYPFEPGREIIKTIDSLGYVITKDIYSPINVPLFRKSAMDGYVLTHFPQSGEEFTIVDTIYAGDQKNPEFKEAECIKIMTGAPVPNNGNVIIVKELANISDQTVSFNIPQTKLNPNICQVGEDIKKRQLLFKSGTRISSVVISSLISCGIFELEVYSKPKILLVTTGSEIVNDDQDLKFGQIYNSNLGYLLPHLKELGFVPKVIHLKDDVTDLKDYFTNNFDLIITTAAISVGDKDFIRKFINQGQNLNVHFDRVNIMPGGPCVFWSLDNTEIISLAGSPYANFVTFELFVRRILSKLTCDSSLICRTRKAVLNETYTKSFKKRRFVKAHVNYLNQISFPATNHKASSMFEMNLCNCFVNLQAGNHQLQVGEQVEIIDLRRNYE